jgi:hypothetical protein
MFQHAKTVTQSPIERIDWYADVCSNDNARIIARAARDEIARLNAIIQSERKAFRIRERTLRREAQKAQKDLANAVRRATIAARCDADERAMKWAEIAGMRAALIARLEDFLTRRESPGEHPPPAAPDFQLEADA